MFNKSVKNDGNSVPTNNSVHDELVSELFSKGQERIFIRSFFFILGHARSGLFPTIYLFQHLQRIQVKFFFMSKYQYYTQEGYDNLKNKLQEMKTRGRTEIARQIAEARDKGDLSENAEYDAAKDAQGLLESEISKLETLMANARILDESDIDTSTVSLMNKVKIKNVKNGAIMQYTLVAEEEANLKEGKISINSPFAKGLLGKSVGDMAQIQAPAGVVEVEILEITL